MRNGWCGWEVENVGWRVLGGACARGAVSLTLMCRHASPGQRKLNEAHRKVQSLGRTEGRIINQVPYSPPGPSLSAWQPSVLVVLLRVLLSISGSVGRRRSVRQRRPTEGAHVESAPPGQQDPWTYPGPGLLVGRSPPPGADGGAPGGTLPPGPPPGPTERPRQAECTPAGGTWAFNPDMARLVARLTEWASRSGNLRARQGPRWPARIPAEPPLPGQDRGIGAA
jgi:hypothetical protein